jgi:hypothetical protein
VVHPWLLSEAVRVEIVHKELPSRCRIDEACVQCGILHARRLGLVGVYYGTRLSLWMSLEGWVRPVLKGSKEKRKQCKAEIEEGVAMREAQSRERDF